jgi:hypothetical protein
MVSARVRLQLSVPNLPAGRQFQFVTQVTDFVLFLRAFLREFPPMVTRMPFEFPDTVIHGPSALRTHYWRRRYLTHRNRTWAACQPGANPFAKWVIVIESPGSSIIGNG